MLTRFLYFSIFFLLAGLTGCKPTGTTYDTSGMISLKITPEVPEIYVGDLIAGYELVPLETTEDNFISRIDKMIVTEDHIVIADLHQFEMIWVFDRNGKSISTIHRQGRGPQEYMDLRNVVVTPDNQLIAALDNGGQKMLFYRFDGSFAGSQPLSFWFSGFEYLDEDNIAVANYGVGKRDPGLTDSEYAGYLLFFTDPEFTVRSGAIPNIYSRDYNANTPHLKRCGEDVFVNPSYSDTIYRVTPGKLHAQFHLDMRGIDGVTNFPANVTNKKREELLNSKASFYGENFHWADSCLLFNITTTNQGVDFFLFDSRRDSLLKLANQNKDDTKNYSVSDLNIYSLFRDAISAHNDQFISVFPSFIVAMLPEKAKNQTPEFEGITEDSNPILVFYTLKK